MLRIEGLNTHYGACHVLQGVDLDVPTGRICAVLGRNGVGKTTTAANLAAALARGLSPAAHAKARRVSVETVRTHLAALRRKTGCRRQAEIALLAARLAGG